MNCLFGRAALGTVQQYSCSSLWLRSDTPEPHQLSALSACTRLRPGIERCSHSLQSRLHCLAYNMYIGNARRMMSGQQLVTKTVRYFAAMVRASMGLDPLPRYD